MNSLLDSSWNAMAHGDAREGNWRGNWRMQWVASTLHTTSEHGVSSITTADAHTSADSSRLNWRPPADLNGLVRFIERRNLVSARVPSRFKRRLHNLLCRLSLAQGWCTVLRSRDQTIDLKEILSCAHWDFEEQNKVLESSKIVTNCIISTHYNLFFVINATSKNAIRNKMWQ